MSRISLTVNGENYEGWLGASVQWSLDDMVSAFAIEYFDRWSASGDPWRIFPDDECVLYVDGVPIIAGHVVQSEVGYDAETISLTTQGYSYTGILAKSTASHKTGHWRNQDLATIIDDLVSPYGVTAVVDSNSAPDKIQRFDLEDGETAAAAIERLCRMLGLTATCNQDGFLIVGRSSNGSINGQTVSLPSSPIERRIRLDNGDRYSDYLCKGQLAGTEKFHGPSTALQSAEAKDEGVRVFSPLLIDAEGPGGKKHLGTRAKYERNVRYGRSRTIALRFDSIYDRNGVIMSPGSAVHYTDPHLGISGDFVIGSFDLELSLSGFFCTVELVPPETFDVLDLPQSAWRRRR